MKKYTLFFLVIFSLTVSCTKEVVIPFAVTTDMHGAFENLSSLSSFIKEKRTENSYLITLDNGDFLQGTPSLYYYSFVESEKKHIASSLMNFIKYDAVSVGNHDIESGSSVYKRVEKEFDFPWISANIIDKITKKPIFKPYAVITRGKIKIAVLGMSTLTSQKALKSEEKETIELEDLISSAEKWIKMIKENENPDIIIGLFHEGYEFSEPVAKKVSGFDIIFVGHDHTEVNRTVESFDGSKVLLIGTEDQGKSIAYAEISIKSGKKTATGTIYPVKGMTPDPGFHQYLSRFGEKTEKYEEKIISQIDKKIDTNEDNSEYLKILHETLLKLTDAEISITAPVAKNVLLRPGNITVSHLFSLYPFDNNPVVLTLSGNEINKLIKHSQTLQNSDSPVKRFYNNLSVNYRTEKPIQNDIYYKVAMNSYHANNGGNMLSNGIGITKQELQKRIVKVYPENIRDYLFEPIK